MLSDPTEPTLLSLIARCLKLPLGRIGENADTHNTRQWDSLHHMLLMAEIENSYGIVLSDDEIAAATSVVKIRQVLRDHGCR